MNAYSVTVDLPEILFKRIERTAQGLNQPMPQALLKIVESNLPSLDKVPVPYRTELEAMESWSDQQLWRSAKEAMSDRMQQELGDLLDKNRHDNLSTTEQARLDQLHAEANRLMLRKSYALALLKWRGNQLTTFNATRIAN
ncbi:MAG: hypothetical protein IAE85_05560 [Anaerolinea sp.]|nr:hypothetical protein [Anaerolinea sp.]